MSSFDAPALLTLAFPALIAIAAIATGMRALQRQKHRLRHAHARIRHLVANTLLASGVIDEHGRLLSLDHAPDCDALWFAVSNATDSIVWELPGTSIELSAEIRAASQAAAKEGSSSCTHEHDDLCGRLRRYEITFSRLEHSHRQDTLAHIVIADRTLEQEYERLQERALTYRRGLFLHSPDAIVCVEFDRPGISPHWPTEQQIDAFVDGRIIDCNETYASRVGQRHAVDVIGHRLHEIIPRSAENIDLLTRIIESGYTLQSWYSPVAPTIESGISSISHYTCTAEFEDSRVIRTWNVFRDITDKLEEITAVALGSERRKTLLHSQEAYFFFEHTPAIDTNLPTQEQAHLLLSGRLVECNAAYAAHCGAESPESIIGLTVAELTNRSPIGNDYAAFKKRIQRFIEDDYILEDERNEITQPNGPDFVSVLNCRGVVKDGLLTHHWAMLRDLSEREAQARDLQRSEARFERIAQHSPALIYRLRVGNDPGFEFVSDAIELISGYPRDHERINDIVLHEVFSPENLKLLASQIESGGTGPVLTSHQHRDGNIVYLEHRMVPMRNSTRRPPFIEGVALDVTERLNSQQQLQNALHEIRNLSSTLQHENVQLREEIRSVRSFHLIVGNSPQFRNVIELAARVAPSSSTVLILGETGTGKELFARSIHQSSTRATKPMISINCAALPPTLIESELFGHTKGAFTGANEARIGRFEAADGGTLFLDEIGELSLDLQSKLLRVVQEGELERLGDNKTIKIDVRLIAATNADLATAVERGDFRADLYYRLNVIPIVIPPLRDRTDDIPILANHFATKHTHRLGKQFEAISPELLQALMKHDWPGNVRELESVIERAIIVSPGGTLQPVNFNTERRRPEPRNVNELPQTAEVLQRSLHDAERHHILHTLEQSDWVIEGRDGAAEKLGIAPSTLRSKMKKLGIRRPEHHDTEYGESTKRSVH